MALACQTGSRQSTPPREGPAADAGSSSPPASLSPAAGDREPVQIPGGRFLAGTPPGRLKRDPTIEPALREVALGPFSIDRWPFPDEAGRPLLGVTREVAVRLCGQAGARLCTELEWERACKGPASHPFAEGLEPRPECGAPGASCASGFGVRSLGALREWTRSSVAPPEGEKGDLLAAVRGARAGSPPAARRCANREGVDPSASPADVGFRCCRGAPNAASIPPAELGTTFRHADVSLDALSGLLGAHERTRALARNLSYFAEPEAVETVRSRGPGDDKGFLFTSRPLLWNPVAGAHFLVIVARSGKDTSFVVVYAVDSAATTEHAELASSFVMLDEPGPIVLAYNGYIRPRLHFSSCWGCPGETGKVLYRDPDGAIVLQP